MSGFSSSRESGRGSALDRLLLFCALLTLVCALGVHGVDRLTQDGELPALFFARVHKHPGVDQTATAAISLRGSSAVLNPCGPN